MAVDRIVIDSLSRPGTRTLVFFLLIFLLGGVSAKGEPIGKYGKLLDVFFEELHVEQYWIAGHKIEWKTGVPVHPEKKHPISHSYCSAFVAAVCLRLEINILMPPEHDLLFLANAQGVWLENQGGKYGWFAVPSAEEAQALANMGFLIIASYREHLPGKRGHIAIVRPSTKSDNLIDREGPDIIQAGKTNYSLTSVSIGFQSFGYAFKNNKIRYFAHYIPHESLKKISKHLPAD
jgi:hypothetical protein